MKYNNFAYQRIVATGECSDRNAEVGDMWLETRSFDKDAKISDIVKWAGEVNVSGKLIITIDQGSLRELTEQEKKEQDEVPF